MGDNRREPEEIVEVYRGGRIAPEEPAQEVVETYVQPDSREIVETYSYQKQEWRTPDTTEVHLLLHPTLDSSYEEGNMPVSVRDGQPFSDRKRPSRRKRHRRTGLVIFLVSVLAVTALSVAFRFVPYFFARPNEDWSDGSEEEEPWMPWMDEFYYEDESSDEINIPVYTPLETVELVLSESSGQILTAQEIYDKVNPSVVTVIVQLDSGASVGTGIIFTEDGYLLTNYHVVAGGQDCTVTLENDHTFSAQYVVGDADNDIAVMKIAANKTFPAAEIGDSSLLKVGDKVYAIGNPLGIELRGTFTDGIVSAINRDVEVDGRTMTLVQTNAALNSGNSGGPLINEYGQVIGINTVKMSSSYSNIEGLGFALPSTSVQYLVNELLLNGEIRPEPELGISIEQISTQLDDNLWGLRVDSVTEGGAADLAGMREGDYVIQADGEDIMSIQDLRRVRRRFHVGDQLEVTVWRDGQTIDLILDLQTAAES